MTAECERVEVAKPLPVGTNCIGSTKPYANTVKDGSGTDYRLLADADGHQQVDVLSGGSITNYTAGIPPAGVTHGSKSDACTGNLWLTLGTVPTGKVWYVYAVHGLKLESTYDRVLVFSINESTTYFFHWRVTLLGSIFLTLPVFVKATAGQRITMQSPDGGSFHGGVLWLEGSA